MTTAKKSNGNVLRNMLLVWKQRRKRVRVTKSSFWVVMVRVGITLQRQNMGQKLGM